MPRIIIIFFDIIEGEDNQGKDNQLFKIFKFANFGSLDFPYFIVICRWEEMRSAIERAHSFAQS